MAIPTDPQLYDEVKREIYRRMPTHSAYRSGQLVKAYKAAYFEKHGRAPGIPGPYQGPGVSHGLRQWFDEQWRNQRGEVGYQRINPKSDMADVYRPTIRVNEQTPTTFSELTAAEIKRARREKKRTGRVKRFCVNSSRDLIR
jgi:hypothetical protein